MKRIEKALLALSLVGPLLAVVIYGSTVSAAARDALCEGGYSQGACAVIDDCVRICRYDGKWSDCTQCGSLATRTHK